MNYSIDLWPIVRDVVMPTVSVLAPLIGLWVAQRISRWLHLKNEGVLRDVLNVAITHGLALAQSRVAQAGDAGQLAIHTKNELVSKTVNYVLDHEPEAAKALGYDPQLLAQKISAHLELNTTPAAQSVAVPTPEPKR